MNKNIRKRRTPIFVAVEGKSEQSFIKFLQQICRDQDINVALQVKILGGGGYESMLNTAINRSGDFTEKILIVDGDRADHHDDKWDLDTLRGKADKRGFTLCVQQPDFEGFLVSIITPRSPKKPIKKVWPKYEKPQNTLSLSKKISYKQLIYASKFNQELYKLLQKIGLVRKT